MPGGRRVSRRFTGSASGALTPEGLFPQRFCTKPALWRQFGATGRLFAATSYEVAAVASIRRRKARSRSNPVRDPRRGVNSEPQGQFWRHLLRKPLLWRHSDATRPVLAATAAETFAVASIRRHKARSRSNSARNRRCGVTPHVVGGQETLGRSNSRHQNSRHQILSKRPSLPQRKTPYLTSGNTASRQMRAGRRQAACPRGVRLVTAPCASLLASAGNREEAHYGDALSGV